MAGLIGPLSKVGARAGQHKQAAKTVEARKEEILTPLLCHLKEAGLGHALSEIDDAESPTRARLSVQRGRG